MRAWGTGAASKYPSPRQGPDHNPKDMKKSKFCLQPSSTEVPLLYSPEQPGSARPQTQTPPAPHHSTWGHWSRYLESSWVPPSSHLQLEVVPPAREGSHLPWIRGLFWVLPDLELWLLPVVLSFFYKEY